MAKNILVSNVGQNVIILALFLFCIPLVSDKCLCRPNLSTLHFLYPRLLYLFPSCFSSSRTMFMTTLVAAGLGWFCWSSNPTRFLARQYTIYFGKWQIYRFDALCGDLFWWLPIAVWGAYWHDIGPSVGTYVKHWCPVELPLPLILPVWRTLLIVNLSTAMKRLNPSRISTSWLTVMSTC